MLLNKKNNLFHLYYHLFYEVININILINISPLSLILSINLLYIMLIFIYNLDVKVKTMIKY